MQGNKANAEIQKQLKTKLGISRLEDLELEFMKRKISFLDVWKVNSLLGVGAFGVVLDVTNLRSKEVNALKIVTLENEKKLF